MTDSERQVWVVRHGKKGEDESDALDHDLAIIGWGDLNRLDDLQRYEDVRDMVASAYTGDSPSEAAASARQLFAFAKKIKVDDIIVLPLKQHWGQIAIGTVSGEYKWQVINDSGRHTRSVTWKSERASRDDLPSGLLRSVSSPPTVYRVGWEGAAQYFGALLDDQAAVVADVIEESSEPPPAINPREEILDFIRQHFVGHEMQRLVAAVFEADGYVVRESPKGPDGGVDVLAGRGTFGFESPRIVVQVKARNETTGVTTLRELRDAMRELEADHGLIVSWSGYSKDVERERRREHFRIRLWDAENLLDAVLSAYGRLPESLRDELPLKQVWTLRTENDSE